MKLLRNLLLTSVSLVLLHPGIQGPANAEVGEQFRYNELRRLADGLKVDLERRQGEGLTLILPNDFPRIPNYVESRSADGKRIITPSGDSLYRDCMINMRLGLGLDVGGSFGADPAGLFFGGITSYARSQLAAQQCVTDYRERLYSALSGIAVDQDIGRVRIAISDANNVLRDVQDDLLDRSVELEDLGNRMRVLEQKVREELGRKFRDQLTNLATKEELQQLLDTKISSLRNRMEAYFAEAQRREMAAAERQRAQQDIQYLASGLSAVADLLFRDDPVTRNAMKSAIANFAALAQIAITLTSGATGFQAFMLVLSAAGVINNMMGTMGRMGPTTDELILREVQELRKSLGELREELRTKLEDIVRMIDNFAQYASQRFDNLDARVQATLDLLRQFKEEDEVRRKISDAALAYLLTGNVRTSMQTCLEGFASRTLTEPTYAACLGDFKLYATDIAKADLIAGSGRIARDPLSEVGQRLYLSIDGGQSFGYLLSFYERIGGRLLRPVPHPGEWARGADAYLYLIGQYPADRFSTSKDEVLRAERRNIERMVAEAQAIKLYAKLLRKEGVSELLRTYLAELRALALTIAEGAAPQLAERNLGIVAEEKIRSVWVEQVGGHSSVFRGCARISIYMQLTVGAAKGEKVEFKRGDVCGPSQFTNRDNDTPLKNSAMAWLNIWPEDRFAWAVLKNQSDANKELHRKMLDTDNTDKMPDQVLSFIEPMVFAVFDSKESEAKYARLGFLKHLLLEAMVIGQPGDLDSDSQNLVQVISRLPSDASALRAVVGTIDYKGNVKLKDAVAQKLNERFDDLIKQANGAADRRVVGETYPFLDRTLRRLQLLVQ